MTKKGHGGKWSRRQRPLSEAFISSVVGSDEALFGSRTEKSIPIITSGAVCARALAELEAEDLPDFQHKIARSIIEGWGVIDTPQRSALFWLNLGQQDSRVQERGDLFGAQAPQTLAYCALKCVNKPWYRDGETGVYDPNPQQALKIANTLILDQLDEKSVFADLDKSIPRGLAIVRTSDRYDYDSWATTQQRAVFALPTRLPGYDPATLGLYLGAVRDRQSNRPDLRYTLETVDSTTELHPLPDVIKVI